MEKWRDVPGTDGKYQISIDTKEGRCRNTKTGRMLSNKPSQRDGRMNWGLYIDGKVVSKQAARWIAITYPELVENEFFEGADIDHKDTDRLNNQPYNLRWCTRKGNMQNEITRERIRELKTGELNHFYGKHHTKDAIDKIVAGIKKYHANDANYMRPVMKLSLNNQPIKVYRSSKQAEKETNIRHGNILACCKGKRKTAGGYKWNYAE